jgi:hypothetical protein
MSGWSEQTMLERENLGTKFVDFGKQVCEKLKEAGYWADLIDPAVGKPV